MCICYINEFIFIKKEYCNGSVDFVNMLDIFMVKVKAIVLTGY